MTKVLVVSDSHGWEMELEKLKQMHEQEAEIMIHCGDSELSAADKAIDGFVTVQGNCDYERFPEEAVKEVNGRKIFVTHGHHYSVKTSLMRLQYRAKELDADIVCFGHSHLLGAELVDNILFVNPGSIRLPRGRTERTYILLDLLGDEVTVHVYDYDKGEITELIQHFSLSKK